MVKVVLVDKDDKVVGFEEKTKAHKNPVPLHRAISVLIYDKDRKKMLLQKRASNKPTWPLYWSNATCTHPLKGETYRHAAQRRLKEEMGFSTPLKQIFKFSYHAKYDDIWGENELDAVFEGYYEGAVKPDPIEAADYKWVSLKELKKDVKKNPGKYSPWFKIILKKLKF